jgi:hypothetical protein
LYKKLIVFAYFYYIIIKKYEFLCVYPSEMQENAGKRTYGRGKLTRISQKTGSDNQSQG